MKKILLILLLFCFAKAKATNYYMSATGGDGGSGTAKVTAWQTLGKLNTSFGAMTAGDSVLFRRGDTFVGGILVNKSGIKIGAYGTGANPVITGLFTIPAWTNLGSNVWESTSAVSTLSYTNMVLVNGVEKAMGRTPNAGSWYTYQSHAAKYQVTSSDLSGTPNWTGAEVAIFITSYGLNRAIITSQSGGTISFAIDSVQEKIQGDGQKFFIQNDARTLDQQNEWYYNPSTKKIRMYSVGSPTNVQISTVENTLEVHYDGFQISDVDVNGIDFIGANSNLVLLKRVNNCSFKNCNLSYAGMNGFSGPYWGASIDLLIDNCTIRNVNNTGIGFTEEFTRGLVNNVSVRDVGVLIGMGAPAGSYSYSGLYSGIHVKGPKNKVTNSRVLNIAYNGIVVAGDSCWAVNNYVDTACTWLHDGAGIYTWNNDARSILGGPRNGQRIQNNIVRNVKQDVGIYADDGSDNIEISGNTVEGCDQGFYFHNVTRLDVHHNTAYNNTYTALSFYNDDPSFVMATMKLNKNTFIGKTETQRAAYFYSYQGVRDGLIQADSNIYAVPIKNTDIIDGVFEGGTPTIFQRKTFEQWQTISGKEANSSKLFKTISDVNDFRFEFNSTNSNKTIDLGTSNAWLDAAGNTFSGSVVLPPFASVVLLKNGSYTPPTDAGPTDVWRFRVKVKFRNSE